METGAVLVLEPIFEADLQPEQYAYRQELSEAVRRLSREFDLSERQAYRYLEEASQLDRAIEIPEATVSITLKLPPRTVELLRKYAKSSGLTIGAIVTTALNAFLQTLKRHG